MRIRSILALVLLLLSSIAAHAQGGLDIYFVDVEGGAATLVVTPAGESVLIDCGSPGDRDADRILHVAKDVAGLKQIDHLIATHWHSDHFGGTPDLVKRIPVGRFYHRGITEKGDEGAYFDRMIADYKRVTAGKTTTLKAGDRLKLRSASGSPAIWLSTICGSRQVGPGIGSSGQNPIAAEFKPKEHDPSDNAESLGFILEFGGFRFLDLGDLTWNVEQKLVDPMNRIGLIDVYQTTHHGLDQSNNPVLIKSVSPRVAIFNNGPRKGGHPDVTRALRALPEIKAIYQGHKNLGASDAENTEPHRIANTSDSPQCKGEFIKLSVAPDAKSYTVQIGANGKKERFVTRK